MRHVAAAILVLAGTLGIGLGETVAALRSAEASATIVGWIAFVLGIALLIIEYVALSSEVSSKSRQS